jgi:tetratricopeptide (TPR) repeat protein
MEAIEGLHRGRLVEHVDRLADHAFRAATWDRAVRYLRQAGDRAKNRSAFAEAVASFERALEAIAHLPASPEWMAQAIDVRFSLRAPLSALTRYGRVLDYMREAERTARLLGDRRRLGWALALAAHALRAVGNQQQVVDSASEALAIAGELDDADLKGNALQYLAQGHVGLGQHVAAVQLLREAIALFDAASSPDPGGLHQGSYARAWLGQALGQLGRFTEAIAVGEEAVRVAEATDRPWNSIIPLGNLGATHVARGDLELAVPLLERAIEIGRSWDLGSLYSPAPGALAYAHALSGRVDEGVAILEDARPNIASSLGPARILFALGQVYLLAGRLDEALETTQETLALVRRRREPEIEARCLALLGGTAARRVPADVDQAEMHYRAALELAEPRELRPLVAHCHRGLGTVLAQAGQRERAATHLARAVALYREMDMRFWLPAAERELATLQQGGGA